ncbi:hypothetical protein FP026_02985 [Rhizobium tropici]|uniref:Uncharacterized protein n=1 Tax=Rhizobium tropici TaxID=398 RepID=A0A5B0WBV0_RHITR|nr:hypothetical protein [Rhizobium tropici]KAA1184373.1 hypothetical protein FP026_02985 [Rhizobium tropici]
MPLRLASRPHQVALEISRELEEYFETYAELRARGLPGNDSLPDDCRIGPLSFGQYRTAIVTGMARCLKHAAFVDTLPRRASHEIQGVLADHCTKQLIRRKIGLNNCDHILPPRFVNALEDLPENLIFVLEVVIDDSLRVPPLAPKAHKLSIRLGSGVGKRQFTEV